MDEVESWVVTQVGQPMWTRFMEFQMWYYLLLCGSVWNRAQKRNNGRCLASRVFSGRKLYPGSHRDDRHFSFSPYATDVLQVAVPVLEPRGSESEYVLNMLWALKEKLLENPAVSSTAPTPTDFCSQKLWGLIILELEPWAGWPGVRLGSLAPEISFPIFIQPPMGMGLACSMSPCLCISASLPLLLVWMNVTLIPGCWTATQLDFLTVLGDSCFVI